LERDDTWFNNIAFILVRPEFVGNIGSAARVIKNFGFRDLRLVTPPKNYKDSEARMMAVGAFDILKECTIAQSLHDALGDINLSVALSSGRKRSRTLDNLRELAPDLAAAAGTNKIAFVFGNERNGLLDDELSLCNRRVRIESSPTFAALNVSQAVGVVAYAVSTVKESHRWQPKEKQLAPELPSTAEMEELFVQIGTLLDKTGFSRKFNRKLVLTELKDAYNRMYPTRRELSLLRGILHRLNQSVQTSPDRSDEDVKNR
jgi:tRNA (cytidine32/uridine32-2'-O)-methyltransferase